MRSFLKPAAGVVCLVALACAGCSSGGDDASDGASAPPGRSAAAPSPSPSASESSATSYAPYVSATTASATDSAGSPTTYNLAFVISDGNDCTPSWNGTYAIGDTAVKSRISALKKSGASVRVSFGGASGKELASTCDSASELAAAYGAALDAAGSTQADFDVEGDQLTDSGSVALRSEAIGLLQKERTDLTVSFTLPVMPSGLDDDGLALLESANDHSVKVSTVNIMTMNYGSSYADDMGDYAITSAEAAHDQLKDVFGLSDAGAWQGLALTSMIGVNDVDNETFGLSDAAQVREFAERKGVAWVSMWSTFRDQQCGDDDSASDDAATDCSGVKQSSGAFAKTFAG
ncbi:MULTISPECIES: chitinase [unclassified Streptomyces]|uniref:chitinase n=1 Tax=unclassified Streptomyces TaxID=2593676 RepID=UPI00224E5DFC|nr:MULTISPECIES: chitinase [unclassified Streptomyces]MCX4989210.1 chitinase [Streptomyces sp. NBC_00568]MCX5005569.1 chitinase [Streptomyces sp. NBC_00638]